MLDKLRKECTLLVSKDPEKYSIIQEILANDNAFFELDVDTSFAILRDLGIQENDLKKVYLELIKKVGGNYGISKYC